MKQIKTTTEAHKAKLQAKQKRLIVADAPDRNPGRNLMDSMLADKMDQEADTFLTPLEILERGTGGELIPPSSYTVEEQGELYTLDGQIDALKRPDSINLEASIRRVDLADKCGVFDLALDTAESINAKNSVEQMLAHQMAAAHKLAMEQMAKARSEPHFYQQMSRLNMSVRLMDAFQKGIVALHKTRRNGDQTVTVQHVQVNGGQAIVASLSHAHARGEQKEND